MQLGHSFGKISAGSYSYEVSPFVYLISAGNKSLFSRKDDLDGLDVGFFVHLAFNLNHRERSFSGSDDVRLAGNIREHEGEFLVFRDLVRSSELKCRFLDVRAIVIFRQRFARSIPVVFYGRDVSEYAHGNTGEVFQDYVRRKQGSRQVADEFDGVFCGQPRSGKLIVML